MIDCLSSPNGTEVFERLKPSLRAALVAFNELRFPEGQTALSDLNDTLAPNKDVAAHAEQYLNDLWVLQQYVRLFAAYGLTWEKILNHHFTDSWSSLQDALDGLRTVRQFSRIDIRFLENQLLELERLYPYNVFFSVGMIVKSVECSICGKDIDSQECPHRRGQLYGGVMAVAIVKECAQLDHVAIVQTPVDKRCVVSYADDGAQFEVVRHLASMLASKALAISDFGRLRFTKRKRPNPHFQVRRRNDLCFCGSGAKFKKCCISKQYVEVEQVEILSDPKCIEDAIV